MNPLAMPVVRKKLVVLVLTLAFSLLTYFVFRGPLVERTLFFPGSASEELFGERRLLRRTDSLESDVRTLVNDALLGPMEVEHRRFLPRNSRARSVMVRDTTAFIDLTAESLFLDEDDTSLGFTDGVAALEKTIRFNFRGIHTILVTVQGRVPGDPPVYEAQN